MRLCAEIIAERVIQLQQDRDHHREQRAIDLQISMFEQQSVHFRMAKFNSQLPSLQVSACVTCSEKFPSLNVRTVPLGTGHTVYVVARTSISLNCTPQATTWIQAQYSLNYRSVCIFCCVYIYMLLIYLVKRLVYPILRVFCELLCIN